MSQSKKQFLGNDCKIMPSLFGNCKPKLELEALKLINYCLTCFLKYYHADSDYGTLRPKVYIKTAKLQFGGNQYAL